MNKKNLLFFIFKIVVLAGNFRLKNKNLEEELTALNFKKEQNLSKINQDQLSEEGPCVTFLKNNLNLGQKIPKAVLVDIRESVTINATSSENTEMKNVFLNNPDNKQTYFESSKKEHKAKLSLCECFLLFSKIFHLIIVGIWIVLLLWHCFEVPPVLASYIFLLLFFILIISCLIHVFMFCLKNQI